MKRFGLLVLCTIFFIQGYSSEIDKIIENKLASKAISPSEICSDHLFLRRAYLIMAGRIPSAEQSVEFIKDQSPEKREKLIDKLLNSEWFVQSMLLRWGELLRIKSEFPSNHWPNGVQAYNRWLTEKIRANTPYDEFVKEMLLSTGSNFRDPQVNFYRPHQKRTPSAYCKDISLIFLCQRTYPEKWEQFFEQVKFKKTKEWKEEIIYLDRKINANKKISLSDTYVCQLKTGEDFRVPFVDWLVSSDNPQFAKAIVNRIWFWTMGKGIVDECDDMSPENLPSNPELLDYLSKELVDNNYDLKHLFREILTSDAFSRSSLTNQSNENDVSLFSHYPTSRLNAEQLIDGICDITEVPDKYSSRAPEPFTNFPSGTRATDISDGTVTTSQLELFGRPSRDNSYVSNRNNSINYKQVLYLLNSSKVTTKIKESPIIKEIVKESKKEVIYQLYLRVLSRYPTKDEIDILTKRSSQITNQIFAEDLMWSLINSNEFLFLN